MPVFMVNTNYAKASVPAALLSEATVELSKAMGNPGPELNQMIMFGGTTAPCSHGSIHSIGVISEEQNLQYSKLLCGRSTKTWAPRLTGTEHAHTHQIYINFFKMETQNVAWDSTIFVVHIVPDQLMTFGGTTAHCAHSSLHSIGAISEEQNLQYSTLLCGLLNKHLGITPNRIYINFFEMEAQNMACHNTALKVFFEAYHA
ncbi:unnamed protein product [Coregonus sp. 'balchen']|nr:unnamed protein product [Coregonus sp. 'balchen']